MSTGRSMHCVGKAEFMLLARVAAPWILSNSSLISAAAFPPSADSDADKIRRMPLTRRTSNGRVFALSGRTAAPNHRPSASRTSFGVRSGDVKGSIARTSPVWQLAHYMRMNRWSKNRVLDRVFEQLQRE